MEIHALVAKEFGVTSAQALSVAHLLEEGNTIPFIARYRKEATGSLDDQTLRRMSERIDALKKLQARREQIAAALTEQGVLTDKLCAALDGAQTLAELEDLYRPFRPKRRTRSSLARERGLEPLSALLLGQQLDAASLLGEAERFVQPENQVPTAEEALAGARDIIAETLSDDASKRKRLRETFGRQAVLCAQAATQEDSVYRQYYGYEEPIARMPAHRVLAVARGEREGFLRVTLRMEEGEALQILKSGLIHSQGECARQLVLAAQDAWQRLVAPSVERELRAQMLDRAQEGALDVFAQNLRRLLMQPPIQGRATLGVDPGYRTGCKLAAVDADGRLLETGVAYFTLPVHEKQRALAESTVLGMIRRHGVTAVAIGNGTASREAEAFIAGLLRQLPGEEVQYAIVSEAGASVYSASEQGAEEFPQLDVSLRSAVSIARRLQDPLSELVKIDPRSLGVGQYQHDLKQARLGEALDGVVESCVNAVGVELSTASPALLSHVAGVGPALARNIAAYRDEHGIASRAQLKKVPKLGPRAFAQCAGFLRLRESANPLDATGVHPESYQAAKRLVETLGFSLQDMRGGAPEGFAAKAQAYGLEALAGKLDIGLPTLEDIVRELVKPGRDPRDELPPIVLRSDVLRMEDLQPGMELTGTVRNVVDFGAFVDLGVHQDGLVHVSQMSNRFLRHPSEAVQLGDVVTVWVLNVDKEKNRIALTMRRPQQEPPRPSPPG